jgi:hypothetical protein
MDFRTALQAIFWALLAAGPSLYIEPAYAQNPAPAQSNSVQKNDAENNGAQSNGSKAGPAAPNTRTAPAGEATRASYYGVDLNEYPGDENLAGLRTVFRYTGYWLNRPPGAQVNEWAGKRNAVEKAGLGFLVLFNGRLDAELRKSDAGKAGQDDAAEASALARREGFPAGTVIFLDIEEGGRMLPEQKAYIYAWADRVNESGFRAGVYCSGIPAAEQHGVTVVTAADLREHAGDRQIVFWVANDGCPPSPGCRLPEQAPAPERSGVAFALVWQFAQSPRRPALTKACRATYASDQNCYAPAGLSGKIGLDLNTSREADPSHGRTQPSP